MKLKILSAPPNNSFEQKSGNQGPFVRILRYIRSNPECKLASQIIINFSFFFSENQESSNANLLEGDMIVPTEQKLELLLGQSRGAGHRFRRWPNGVVPYTIDWVLGTSD